MATFEIYQVIKPDPFRGVVLQNVEIQQPIVAQDLISGRPSRLIIASIDLDIEVVDGNYYPETLEWDLSDDKAHYATMTPEANDQAGNTFIYGHNRPKAFRPLTGINIGDEAKVMTFNGKEFIYKLVEFKDVEPADVSLFEYQGAPILTLQTCSGSWYEKRRLYKFELIEVNNIVDSSVTINSPTDLNPDF